MFSIFCACLAFIVTLLIHILISRILLSSGIKSVKLLVIFALGLLGYIQFFMTIIQPLSINHHGLWYTPLPLSSVLLYILLFIFYLIYYLSTYSGEVGPSIKLYMLLRQYGSRSRPEILREFSDQEFIHKRLNSLVEGNFISRNNNVYRVLPKGKKLADLIRLYRSVVGWESSG
jgi:hypothetical protein